MVHSVFEAACKVNMDEFDENGWAHVHHAAYNGYYKSVSRFIKSREDQLELETQDGQQLTPLLLACMNGHLETVQLLVEQLHANLKAQDRQSFGAVELAASKNHIGVLEYLLKLNSPDLEVWKNLIRGLSQSELETPCARALVELTTEENADYLESFLKAGGVQAILGLLKNSLASEESKTFALSVLLNLVRDEAGKEHLTKNRRMRDFGSYVCRVWDKSGAATSDSAVIDVFPAPDMSKYSYIFGNPATVSRDRAKISQAKPTASACVDFAPENFSPS